MASLWRAFSLLGFAVVGLSAVVACGEDDDRMSSGTPAEAAEPTVQSLGFSPVDTQSFLLERDGTAVVVSADEERRLRAWRSVAGGHFEEVAPSDPIDGRFLALSSAIATGNHFVVVGSDYGTNRPVAWRSVDGTVWEPVGASTFTDPGDINDLTVSDGVLVGVGALRTGPDTSSGPFKAAVWHSSDEGESWELTALPVAAGDDSVAAQVAVLDGAIVAIGHDGSGDVMWRSTDDGRSWTQSPVPLEDGEWISDLAASDGTLVAIGGQETPEAFRFVVLRSTDGGATWERADLGAELATGMDEVWSIHVRPDGFWIPGQREIPGPPGEDRCYVDLDRCQNPPEPQPVVLASDDGQSWQVRDAGIVGVGVGLQETELVTAASGHTWLLASAGEGLTVWSWEDAPELPPVTPTPSTTWPVPPEPMAGDNLEPGVRHRAPLYIHCGMEWLGGFNGEVWKQIDGGDVETGAGDVAREGWPVVGQTIYGYVTLVEDDRIEYSTQDGQVIATYAPTDEEPPGCE